MRQTIAVVRCDQENCEETVVGSRWVTDTVREARRKGWATGKKGDWCPQHRESSVDLTDEEITILRRALEKLDRGNLVRS